MYFAHPKGVFTELCNSSGIDILLFRTLPLPPPRSEEGVWGLALVGSLSCFSAAMKHSWDREVEGRVAQAAQGVPL